MNFNDLDECNCTKQNKGNSRRGLHSAFSQFYRTSSFPSMLAEWTHRCTADAIPNIWKATDTSDPFAYLSMPEESVHVIIHETNE